MNAVVELQQVSKCFGKVQALMDLSLTIEAGEILGLLGHNGAGKTTSMKLILGLLTPTRGEVRVFGQSPSLRGGQQRRQIGFLPENVSFYQQLTGRAALRYFARLKNVASGNLDALLERVGLSHAADRKVKTYSKGMRQRLGLAQALLGAPRLLMLDEPTVGLDPTATAEFYSMLDELRGRGSTVILSSHVLAGIEGHIDRAAILGRGRLLAVGSLDELRARADLPCTIRVRADARVVADWQQRFAPDPDIGLRQPGTDLLELQVADSRKLAVLRQLLATSEIEDLAVLPASLDALYAHYNRHLETKQEASCAPF
jgi:Cu-processing system ATP-binding protein